MGRLVVFHTFCETFCEVVVVVMELLTNKLRVAHILNYYFKIHFTMYALLSRNAFQNVLFVFYLLS
jgi:hypothetical protein